MDSDDEDDANEDLDDRDRIQRDIFDETLGSDEDQPIEPRRPRREKDNFDSESESDNENNFIVDDQGNPIYQNKKSKNGNVYVDENLREAANIFDIDPTQLGEMFEDFENEYGEYDEDEPRPAKQKKSKKALTDLYEPDELERVAGTRHWRCARASNRALQESGNAARGRGARCRAGGGCGR